MIRVGMTNLPMVDPAAEPPISGNRILEVRLGLVIVSTDQS